MRHRVHFRKLGRDTAHRLALLRNLTTALIRHERIKTTVAKAKELRRPAEKMVTLAKKGDESSRRAALAWVYDGSLVDKLFGEFRERYAGRPGGYTRVLKAGYRLGDKAPMAYIEYVDNPLTPLPGTTKAKTSVEPDSEVD